jgi:hypothetical protein
MRCNHCPFGSLGQFLQLFQRRLFGPFGPRTEFRWEVCGMSQPVRSSALNFSSPWLVIPGLTDSEGVASVDDLADATADRCGDASQGVLVDFGIAERSGAAEGQDCGERRDHAGSQRGDAFDRAARQWGAKQRTESRRCMCEGSKTWSRIRATTAEKCW